MKHYVHALSSAEALPQTRRKACENKTSGASAIKCAVLGRRVVVLGMCNNNNGSDSRSRISATIHMVGFTMGPASRAEQGVAQDPDNSLTALEL